MQNRVFVTHADLNNCFQCYKQVLICSIAFSGMAWFSPIMSQIACLSCKIIIPTYTSQYLHGTEVTLTGWEMRVAASSPHVVSTASFSSGGHLTLLSWLSMRSLSWETILHKPLQHMSFSHQAAALHKLLQHRSLPQGAVLWEHTASSMLPPQGHKSCQQTYPSTGSLFYGSACPATLWHGIPTGLVSSGHTLLL